MKSKFNTLDSERASEIWDKKDASEKNDLIQRSEKIINASIGIDSNGRKIKSQWKEIKK